MKTDWPAPGNMNIPSLSASCETVHSPSLVVVNQNETSATYFRVMEDDGATSYCPDCGEALSAVPVFSGQHLAMGLSCTAHGSVAVLEPF